MSWRGGRGAKLRSPGLAPKGTDALGAPGWTSDCAAAPLRAVVHDERYGRNRAWSLGQQADYRKVPRFHSGAFQQPGKPSRNGHLSCPACGIRGGGKHPIAGRRQAPALAISQLREFISSALHWQDEVEGRKSPQLEHRHQWATSLWAISQLSCYFDFPNRFFLKISEQDCSLRAPRCGVICS